MPCQSDFGLVYTIYLLAVARMFGYPTYLHHHNFGYINDRRRLMDAALVAGGPEVAHIFLCDYMLRRFGETYKSPKRSLVISNAAFVPPQPSQAVPPESGALRIGLLSNLNREKGLYLFFDLLRAAHDQGLNLQGRLAGPVRDPDDRRALEAAQNELGDRLLYAGPLYGQKKTQFYESIDVFVFPTLYRNEAQPTVVYEALAAGNLIVAHERGCIASQVQSDGLVIPGDQPFVLNALSWLRHLKAKGNTDSRISIALRSSETYTRERAKARNALSS
ncbi:hypothetical protein AOQ72_08620 [Bradyrhizobium yuanmingense]|uniref:Glycosyltransferase n=2 Tax=Bradyrhizobium yuanmingense TaxID=108015 RepID=A0A0R3D436_9BRAD|nr:hypothetical protein AOQ72_08620 [Bradyrhizobium yuanmingense]